jgi:hypothetical protein
MQCCNMDESNEGWVKESDYKAALSEIAALRSQLEAMQWRPIESAPRDGTRILGWYDDFYDAGTGEFVTVYYHAIPYGSWFDTTGMPIESAPDKWMPLPPVPDKPEV